MSQIHILKGVRDDSRLSDAVYETLVDAILSGKLAPGTAVSELALAAQLKVSRTPVHDALRQLAKDGLVNQQPNRRAVVSRFSQDDVQDIYEMRKVLETEAARRAATRLDRATLAQLRKMADDLKALKRGPEWLERWADFDQEFHTAIARASGSTRLYQDIVRYRLLHRGLNKLVPAAELLQEALNEHVRILEALEKRDPAAAARAMRAHLEEWQAYFVNHFPR